MFAFDPYATWAMWFAERELRNVNQGLSLRLDIRGPDHLAPFLCIIGDELAEVGRRAGNHRAAQIAELRFDSGIRETRIDLLVEPVDDLGGCSWVRPSGN